MLFTKEEAEKKKKSPRRNMWDLGFPRKHLTFCESGASSLFFLLLKKQPLERREKGVIYVSQHISRIKSTLSTSLDPGGGDREKKGGVTR